MTEAERYARLAELFARAVVLPVGERGVFVAHECAGDERLRQELLVLLEQSDSAGAAALSQGLVGMPADDDARLPERLGAYRILRRIGEGGMGVVYEAEQDQPRRVVALKVVRAGMQHPQMRRRFAVEAEALGRLHHRGIAQIFEAGTADSGSGPQPYFAMERIDGVPLDGWVREQQPPLAQVVRMLMEICDAVQHAHHNGVIHRDLKPANILVERTGQPKVLDFGVARAIDADLAVATLHTDVGQMVGTLAYMSPEQVEADPSAIDSRTDVYSLGVIAYELLSGRLPIEVRGSSLLEAARMIRDVDPPRLQAIVPRIDVDLDTIVARALEKDRRRRYPSAAALGDDLRRFLEHRPILARPATTAYQLRRFVQRNRVPVLAAAAVMIVLIAGIIGSVSGWMRAVERGQLAEARGAAARREADKVTRIHEFLLDDLLAAPDPRAGGRDVRVVDWLARAGARVADVFADAPDLEAEVRITLGTTYRNLGELAAAEQHLRRAHELCVQTFGADTERTLHAANRLTQVLWDMGRHDEAEPLVRDALQRGERLLGADHVVTLEAANFVGLLLLDRHDAVGAEVLFRRVRDGRHRLLGPDARETLVAAKNLVLALQRLRRDGDAEQIATDTLERRRRLFGADDPDTLHSQHLLGTMRKDGGHYAAALEIFQEVVERRRRVLGAAHGDTLESMNALGDICLDLGRVADAEQLYDELIASADGVEGLSPRDRARYQNGAATAYERARRFDDAGRMYQASLELRRQIYGEISVETALVLNNYGVFLAARSQLTEGLALLEQSLVVRRQLYGDDHPEVANSLINIAALRSRTADLVGAIGYAREAVAILQRANPAGSLESAHAQVVLGRSLLVNGEVEEGCRLLESSVDLAVRLFGADSVRGRQFVANAARFLDAAGQADRRQKLLDRFAPAGDG